MQIKKKIFFVPFFFVVGIPACFLKFYFESCGRTTMPQNSSIEIIFDFIFFFSRITIALLILLVDISYFLPFILSFIFKILLSFF